MKTFDYCTTHIPKGLSVIEASAGTGKTFALSHLVPRLLAEGILQRIGEVLLVTFTNDAAGELSNRVRRVLEKLAAPPAQNEKEEEPGVHQLRAKFGTQRCFEQALREIDQLTVSTIHSFCKRIIDEEGTLCGVPAALELITDAEELIEELVYQAWHEQIVANAELAEQAAIGNWDTDEDIAFIKEAISLENYESCPAPVKLEEALADLPVLQKQIAKLESEILEALRGFDDKTCAELSDLLARVTKWKASAGKSEVVQTRLEQVRTGCLQALAQLGRVPTETTLLTWVKNLPANLPVKGDAGLQQAASALAAVGLAQTVCDLKAELSALKSSLAAAVSALRWSWQHHCLGLVRTRIGDALRRNRQITQDGLITTLRDALRHQINGPLLAQRLRERFKVILIDESQDTDPKQFEIFKLAFGSDDQRIVLIGDPKQAIYGFRGADVNTYLAARQTAEAVFDLTETYRSPAPLVNAVNAFFGRPNSFLKEGLQFNHATAAKAESVQLVEGGSVCQASMEIWVVPDGQTEYQNSHDRMQTITATVASKIVELLNNGKKRKEGKELDLLPSDFAVLTSNKRQANTMAEELKSRGIPAVVASDADVFESDEAGDLFCLLRAIQNPRHSRHRFSALATRLMGKSDAELRPMREGNAEDETFIVQLTQWQQLWADKGIAHAISMVDEHWNIFQRLAESPMGERRVTNLRQLLDLLQNACDSHARRPELLLRWFHQEMLRAADNTAPEERQLRLENDGKAVQVLTMHKAKGLEYDFVFCPYLWDMGYDKASFSKLRATTPDQSDKLVCRAMADDETKFLLTRSQLEDRLRLAYVAMTRAKTRLWIYAGSMGGTKGNGVLKASAMDWLLRGDVEQEQFNGSWLKLPGLVSSRGARHQAAITALNDSLPDQSRPIQFSAPPARTNAHWRSSTHQGQITLTVQSPPDIPHYWRISSFSALTREKNRHGTKESPHSSDTSAEPVLNAFALAPGSALIGSVIHEWIEQWDFAEPDASFDSKVEEHLRSRPLLRLADAPGGLSPAAVADMLRHLRTAILPGLDCEIGVGCPSAKASEWNFHLPLNGFLSPRRMANAFAHCSDQRFAAYAEPLAALAPSRVEGYLQGFMDRLVFHKGRFGVIDWKTNQLGKSAAAYGPEGLWGCAVDNHYLLQAALYLVALRRYLRRRNLPDSSLAGAWLVLLRGVQAGSQRGILHINPPADLLDALDNLFA